MSVTLPCCAGCLPGRGQAQAAGSCSKPQGMAAVAGLPSGRSSLSLRAAAAAAVVTAAAAAAAAAVLLG